ncbi:DinB family protein [Paenibacillus senegalimassiliensis]|uniref:DinB family protein n=1 Tax=Paenibacillus senegalimassiliensis TaxID=1737426 RepID=UPI00073F03DF|nr:DinB family protein [Paenibacillus senegalimassiliensis]
MKKRHEVLFEQLRTYRSELLSLVDGLSDAEADIIPERFNNNIRWNLGHVLLDQYLWIWVLAKEDVLIPSGFSEWFGFGTAPSHFTDTTPKLSTLVELLREQPDLIQGRYHDRMEEEFAPTDMGIITIEQVLIRTIFHEGLHIGAIQALKRSL